jgi:hypothetical protein
LKGCGITLAAEGQLLRLDQGKQAAVVPLIDDPAVVGIFQGRGAELGGDLFL